MGSLGWDACEWRGGGRLGWSQVGVGVGVGGLHFPDGFRCIREYRVMSL